MFLIKKIIFLKYSWYRNLLQKQNDNYNGGRILAKMLRMVIYFVPNGFTRFEPDVGSSSSEPFKKIEKN